LRYAGAYIGDPTTLDTSGKLPLIETNLHVRPLGLWECGAVLSFCFFAAVGSFSCGEKPRSFTNKTVLELFLLSPEIILPAARIITSLCLSPLWVLWLSITDDG
jgi:hypothetical protein